MRVPEHGLDQLNVGRWMTDYILQVNLLSDLTKELSCFASRNMLRRFLTQNFQLCFSGWSL